MNLTSCGVSMPHSVRKRSRPAQNSGEPILAATLLPMNFTNCGMSMPHSVRNRSRPAQNSGESILAATLSLMNVTSCGASMLQSVRKRSRPAKNSGELILVPTPRRERSVLRCLWLKPNLERELRFPCGKRSWRRAAVHNPEPLWRLAAHLSEGLGGGIIEHLLFCCQQPASMLCLNRAEKEDGNE